MLMSLDQFVFSLATVPYRELQRQRNWKHKTSARVGARDGSQFTGVGDDTITLTGLIAPDTIGSLSSLDDLARMADTGDAYSLVDGTGTVYGAFIIDTLNETQTYHTKDGTPRRIEFTITIKHVDDRAMSASRRTTQS